MHRSEAFVTANSAHSSVGVEVWVAGEELGAFLTSHVIYPSCDCVTVYPGMLIHGQVVGGKTIYVRLGPEQFLQGSISQNLQHTVLCGGFNMGRSLVQT